MERRSIVSTAAADQQQLQPSLQQLLLFAGVPGNGRPTREGGKKRGDVEKPGRKRDELLSNHQQLHLQPHKQQQHQLRP
jgi:hypothetical protein